MRILITLGLLTLSLAGCNLGTAAPSATTVVENTSVPPITTEDANADELATYTDTVVGFSFDYPADWQLVAPPDDPNSTAYAITVTSVDFAVSESQSDGVTGSKVDLFVNPVEIDTLEEMRSIYEGPGDGGQVEILEETEISLSNGTPAIRMRIGTIYNVENDILLVVINNRGLLIAGYGDSAYFDLVIESLRAA